MTEPERRTSRGGHCAHCGTYRDLLGGYAQGVRLCHPNVGMDCYRLVTVYKERVGARLQGGELRDMADPITVAATADVEARRWAKLLERLAD